MCKKCNPKHRNINRWDACMVTLCWLINNSTKYKTLGSCCGHGKYPMTVVITRGYGNPLEYFSQVEIPRKRNFYKKDKQGYYYIPETIK